MEGLERSLHAVGLEMRGKRGGEHALTRVSDSGFSGPLPVRSMYFFRSVLRNSNTWKRRSQVEELCLLTWEWCCKVTAAHQIQNWLLVLLHVLHAQEPARHVTGIENSFLEAHWAKAVAVDKGNSVGLAALAAGSAHFTT